MLCRALLSVIIVLFSHSVAKAKVSRVPSPVTVNGKTAGDMIALYENGRYSVNTKEFLKTIKPRLSSELHEDLEDEFDGREKIDITEIKLEKVEIRFNEENLTIELKVSADAKGTNVLNFAGSQPYDGNSRVIEPGWLSGYVNLQASKSFTHQNALGESFDSPLNGSIESVLNVFGVVFESNYDYADDDEPPLQRDDTRMIWDDESNAVRYILGDLAYPTEGFQNFRRMGGLSITREFSIQPYRTVTPSGHNEFFLKSPSEVKIFVNGRFFRELELPEGIHNIRSLPIVRGVNDITLEITDTSGRRELIRFPILSEGDLLAKGVHEFSLNVGAPSDQVDDEIEYDREQITTSAFHRLGITDQLTMGTYYQGDQQQHLVGGEFKIGLPLGFFGYETGYSWTDLEDTGWAHRGRYIYVGNEEDRWLSQDFGFQVEYFDRNFTSLQSLVPNNRFVMNIDANIGQPLTKNWRSGFGYRYQLGRDIEPDLRSFSATLSYGGFRFHQLSGEYTVSDTVGEDDREHRVFIAWTWSGDEIGNYLQTTYSNDEHRMQSEYQYSKNIRNGQVGAAVRASRSEEDYGVGAGFDYVGQRFLAVVDHNRTYPRGDDFTESAQTRVNVGTAFAFTTGSLAISRPITDSFTLIEADDTLTEYNVGINPAGDYSLAEIGLFNTAILSNQASYIYETVRVDTRDFPFGLTIQGGENFVVKPTFKSGVHVNLGSGSVVYIRGKLFDQNKKPMALVAGEIRELNPKNEEDRIVQTFFTNRKGNFSVEGLGDGRYELTLFDYSGKTIFEIPKGTRGAYKIGDIKFNVIAEESVQ